MKLDNQPDLLLTLNDASAISKTTPDALRGAINRNRLRAHKIDRKWHVTKDDLLAYLETKQTWHWTGKPS